MSDDESTGGPYDSDDDVENGTSIAALKAKMGFRNDDEHQSEVEILSDGQSDDGKSDLDHRQQVEEDLSAAKTKITGLRKELSCSVCLQLLHKPQALRCGHSFCRCCVARMLLTMSDDNDKFNCPLCRKAQCIKCTKRFAVNITLWKIIKSIYPKETSDRATTEERQFNKARSRVFGVGPSLGGEITLRGLHTSGFSAVRTNTSVLCTNPVVRCSRSIVRDAIDYVLCRCLAVGMNPRPFSLENLDPQTQSKLKFFVIEAEEDEFLLTGQDGIHFLCFPHLDESLIMNTCNAELKLEVYQQIDPKVNDLESNSVNLAPSSATKPSHNSEIVGSSVDPLNVSEEKSLPGPATTLPASQATEQSTVTSSVADERGLSEPNIQTSCPARTEGVVSESVNSVISDVSPENPETKNSNTHTSTKQDDVCISPSNLQQNADSSMSVSDLVRQHNSNQHNNAVVDVVPEGTTTTTFLNVLHQEVKQVREGSVEFTVPPLQQLHATGNIKYRVTDLESGCTIEYTVNLDRMLQEPDYSRHEEEDLDSEEGEQDGSSIGSFVVDDVEHSDQQPGRKKRRLERQSNSDSSDNEVINVDSNDDMQSVASGDEFGYSD